MAINVTPPQAPNFFLRLEKHRRKNILLMAEILLTSWGW